ncbi:MAG: hypothetical protein LBE49_08650, partial [Deltaproteobacteria bacterium]|nr:hypothetical protein [Deltaproteobacteria bacterium]
MNSHPRTLSAKPLLWPLIANRFSRLFSRLSGFSGGMSVDWSPSHPLLLFLALVPALLFSALLTPASLSAAPKSLDEALAESGAPPELAAWAPWALYDTEDRFCPKELSGEKRCLLPISLEIEVTESGGSFAGRWELKDKALVTLPGQADRWPSQVAASESGGEAKLIPVVGSDLPQVWLEAGSYEIKGAFKWDSPPETLSVPLGPILSVTSLGRKLSFPALDEEPSRGVARIWLKGRESAPAPSQEQEGNRLAVQVDRLVVDSLPMSYRTRLRLIVTGTSREETIKDPLLPDSVPAFLQSALPARIVGGDLRAQVSPGVHDIFIDSRLKERSDSIGPASGRFGVERWAFVARPYLRQVEVSGAPQIDNS